jgi:hypothetical protein
MVSNRTEGKVVNHNYKIVWVYCGLSENVPEMYDKPKHLCLWWMKEHKQDSQYAGGKFYLVSMMQDKTS